MLVSRLCSVAIALSPVLCAGAVYGEPLASRADGLFEPQPLLGASPPGTSKLDVATHAIAVMRPIAISEELAALLPRENSIPEILLPEVKPLEAAKPLKDAEPLRATKHQETAALKTAALQPQEPEGRLAALPTREPLLDSLPKETITLSPMEAVAISGTELSDPISIIVSLKDQRLDIYRGLERIESTKVSTGMRGYQTLTGVFGILQKKKEHYSNLYNDAPMPWMHRLTRTGTAIHEGEVPNYPASHGCIRLPRKFAPKFYQLTEVGGKVSMLTGAMVAPKPIAHPVLFKDWSESGFADIPVSAAVSAGTKNAASVLTKHKTRAKRADAPWRMLVTRRGSRDIAVGTQEALAAMGYLAPQDRYLGNIGPETRAAIKAFQKDQGLRATGHYSEKLAAKIYETAGKGALPDAYLFVRRGFKHVAHGPVTLKNPKKALGTHHFVYTRPSDGSPPTWIGISLEGQDSKTVLDRITIPDDMRAEIAKGLTSGASFIVADKAKHSSVLRDGDDFIVRTNDSAASKVVAQKPKARKRDVAATDRDAKPNSRAARSRTRIKLFGSSSRKRTARKSYARKSNRGFGR